MTTTTTTNNDDMGEPGSRSMSIDSGYIDVRKRTSSLRSFSSLGSEHDLSGYDEEEETKKETEEETKKETELIESGKCILIKPAYRKREMTIDDNLPRTPTPTKYYVLLQENEKMVRSMKK